MLQLSVETRIKKFNEIRKKVDVSVVVVDANGRPYMGSTIKVDPIKLCQQPKLTANKCYCK